jgi:protein phosphatase
MVDDATILALIEENEEHIGAAARALVSAANDAGGEDNITVVLFAVDDGSTNTAAAAADTITDAYERDAEEDTLHGVESPLIQAAPTDERTAWPLGIVAVAAAIGVLALGVLGVLGLSRAHFVGAEPDGHVAVYQGVPWDIGLGMRLYRKVYDSPLLAAHLSENERRRLFDHDLESRADALSTVRGYEREISP